MAIEIERKYLVAGAFPQDPGAKQFVQAYIAREDGRTVRVRFDGAHYTITIKGPSNGIARHEFEFEIGEADGRALLYDMCPKRIEKMRHTLPHGGLTWEVDVFAGQNAGLVVAEVELPTVDTPVVVPDWAGPDVSDDKRFFNAKLLDDPFKTWGISYSELLSAKSA